VAIEGEASSADEAVRAIRESQPDVAFLDIEMPGKNGFDIVLELADHAPAIVFVTAYDQYAVRAFEVEALDYLLKPYDSDRLKSALERLQRRRDAGDLALRIDHVVQSIEQRTGALQRILVTTGGRSRFIRVEDVTCFEAEDNYVRVHCADERPLVRGRLSALEQQLDPARFMRVHRSWLVNLDAVAEVRQMFHGDYRVVLHGGRELPIGRAYRDRFLQSR
ncbi:MAG: LytTR family DNA-binding domain-containing protein, partial [Acidobacteriota bacterium]|nr:LytTR family DNA-binding domain-containing protein [Acidobacteriota bacterium]